MKLWCVCDVIFSFPFCVLQWEDLELRHNWAGPHLLVEEVSLGTRTNWGVGEGCSAIPRHRPNWGPVDWGCQGAGCSGGSRRARQEVGCLVVGTLVVGFSNSSKQRNWGGWGPKIRYIIVHGLCLVLL